MLPCTLPFKSLGSTNVFWVLSSADVQEKKASGAEDLRLALRRLSLRRQNNLSERRFFEEERDWRRGGPRGAHVALSQDGALTPSESIMSLGNLHVWASRGPYLPDKLQIVKPLEGETEQSEWDAEPSLGGERRKVWGWVRKTGAVMERERGKRWARDRAGSRKTKAAPGRKERPLSLMVFDSFWSLMHRHKSGSFASPRSYYRDTQPRGWL